MGILLFALSLSLSAQKTTPKETPVLQEAAEPDFEYHQIYLEKPAKSLNKLEYQKDEKEIKGSLSQDGLRILLKDYQGKGRVKVGVTYEDGKSTEFMKGSCFIDPVPPI